MPTRFKVGIGRTGGRIIAVGLLKLERAGAASGLSWSPVPSWSSNAVETWQYRQNSTPAVVPSF